MRIFSWAGGAALAAAAGVGYLMCEFVHQHAAVPCCAQAWDTEEVAEASEAPPGEGPRLEPVEVIDLTCIPQAVTIDQFVQTTEPPLAGPPVLPGALRIAHFEPADVPELPLPTLPYLKDDPTEPPAKLPALGDPPPVSEPDDPVFQAVQKFFAGAADWSATDKVPLGRPPVCERPPACEVGDIGSGHCPQGFVGPPAPDTTKAVPGSEEPQEAPPARVPRRLAPNRGEPDALPRPWIDTMEVRPGEVPRRQGNEPY